MVAVLNKAQNRLVLAILITVSALLAGCGSNDQFQSAQTQQFFTQSYDPPELDVLWVIDNRTDLTRKPSMVSHLTSEAQTFFTRLDQMTTSDYRMAIIDVDATTGVAGELQPTYSPQILTQGVGDITSRTALFGSIIGEIVNLNVSAINSGLLNTLIALQTTFIPRAGVPMVLVWISDSDDNSTLPAAASGMTKLQYFAQQFQSLTGNTPSLLVPYSVNYLSSTDNCATQYNIDRDQSFTPLAEQLGGSAADLCGSFGSTIDLTGLQLTTLPTSFALSGTPDPSSITISIFDSANNSYPVPSYTYDSSTNSVVFATAPPAGTTIEINYNAV
jgi:hypothetical protein